ncbi:MAG: FAD-binding oxidoreductase [Steroidobacteraceae bacterium]
MRVGRRGFLHAALAAATGTLSAARPLWAYAARNGGVPSELAACSGSGQRVDLAAADVKDLRASLRGPLLLAQDPGYDDARLLWLRGYDRHPALIVRAIDAADVGRAIDFARTHGLLTAVRGGGHSLAGQSVCEGGLTIDLSLMSAVEVDAQRRLASVQGGVLLGEVDRKTQAVGLATTMGTATDTGIAGLTLGGGMGRLMRSIGLACDNLASVDIVTADGKLTRASEVENRDLFWGVRGGGGNFGVVTTFEYRLHRLAHPVLSGARIYPYSEAHRVLAAATEVAERAPDALTLGVDLVNNAPPSTERPGRYAVLTVFHCGDPRDGERLLEPLKRLGAPLHDSVAAVSYLDAQGAVGTAPVAVPRTVSEYTRTGFLPGMSAVLLDELVRRFAATPPSLDCGLELAQMGGAVARVAPSATAYWNRHAAYDLMLFGDWTDGQSAQANTQALDTLWSAVEPFTRGYYVNTAPAEDGARVRATYGENYQRLVRLKKTYDPGNLFSLNANIPPSPPSTTR